MDEATKRTDEQDVQSDAAQQPCCGCAQTNDAAPCCAQSEGCGGCCAAAGGDPFGCCKSCRFVV